MKKAVTQPFSKNMPLRNARNLPQNHKDSTVVELALNSESPTTQNSAAPSPEPKSELNNSKLSTAQEQNQEQSLSIKEAVSQAMQQYLAHLGDQNATNLYQMVMSEVEPALLQVVLDHTRGNQSKASTALGLNRGTLRKKLHLYGIE